MLQVYITVQKTQAKQNVTNVVSLIPYVIN